MRLLLGVAVYLLVISSAAFACSCVSSFGCPRVGDSDHPVFVGTIINVEDLLPTRGFLSSRKARIRVNELFGGLATDVSEVDVLTGVGGGDCGIPFRPGETYLIAAFVSADGVLHAGICSDTRRIDAVGAKLRILRELRDHGTAPSLAGQIARHDRNFEGPLSTDTPKPLRNAVVRLNSQSRSY